MIEQKFIRNFAIIAHIDHGKSTLADRLIEYCKAIESREMKAQILDSMDIERERGITIKSQTVRLIYSSQDGNTYYLNLMDTPGHVDFAYEVSRSLAAVESSVLVIDASQGVEAQTIANVYQAIDNEHEIIPVLNKIDLPAADPEGVKQQIEEVIGIETDNAVEVSAKTGVGIVDLLEAIVKHTEPPVGDQDEKLQALLIDSWYDSYLGVIILVRIKQGRLKKGMKITMLSNKASYQIDNLGIFTPVKEMVTELSAGEIGFFTASIKEVSHCKVGDTIADEKKASITEPLPGFKPNLPVVFCGLYPVDSSEFDKLRDALAKLKLNDASFEYEIETSGALGYGFRCGFLGLLHLEIIQERLDREFNMDLITTAPSVIYMLYMNNGEIKQLHNPADMPDPVQIKHIEEPWVRATILVPNNYMGNVLQLCTEKRGEQLDMSCVGDRLMLVYKLPLSEIVYDFYDRLKSCTKGYASFEWQHEEYKIGNLVKVSILVNQEPLEALSVIVHKTRSESRGRELCIRLKDLIPRQLFKIAIQAAIGGKIIARETISALRKDVTAKCYGGDISRKKKLLEKQKKGKKKMRTVGNVEIPQSAFIAALKIKDD